MKIIKTLFIIAFISLLPFWEYFLWGVSSLWLSLATVVILLLIASFFKSSRKVYVYILAGLFISAIIGITSTVSTSNDAVVQVNNTSQVTSVDLHQDTYLYPFWDTDKNRHHAKNIRGSWLARTKLSEAGNLVDVNIDISYEWPADVIAADFNNGITRDYAGISSEDSALMLVLLRQLNNSNANIDDIAIDTRVTCALLQTVESSDACPSLTINISKN